MSKQLLEIANAEIIQLKNLVMQQAGDKNELREQNKELKAMLEKLRNDVMQSEIDARESAEGFDKRHMETSHYCSKAMETAYKICGEKIDSLIQSVKQTK